MKKTLPWQELEVIRVRKVWECLYDGMPAEEQYQWGVLLEAIRQGNVGEYILAFDGKPINVHDIDWTGYEEQKQLDQELQEIVSSWLEKHFPNDVDDVTLSVRLGIIHLSDLWRDEYFAFTSQSALNNLRIHESDSVWSALSRL